MSNTAPNPPILVRRQRDIVAALRYMLTDPATHGAPENTHDRLVWPIVPLGLAFGLLWVGSFRAAWRIFGEVGSLRLIPSLALVVLIALFSGRSMLRAAMRLVESPRATKLTDVRGTPVGEKSLMLLILILLGYFVLILSIQEFRGFWPAADDWRSWFNWMYPRPIYRPLLLSPMWGHWGMLVALCSGRTAPDADPLTRAYSRDLNAWKLFVHSVLPLGLTCIYLTRGSRIFTGPMIAALLFGMTILFSSIVANLRQGQSRVTILATGLFSQTMFIVLYRAFWPLIER